MSPYFCHVVVVVVVIVVASTSKQSDFAVYLRSDMTLGGLIMTKSWPLLRATYEDIPLHPSIIF